MILKTALKKMKRVKVKRLPVVGKNRELVGILSITDFLVSLKKDKSVRKKVYSTLKATANRNRLFCGKSGVGFLDGSWILDFYSIFDFQVFRMNSEKNIEMQRPKTENLICEKNYENTLFFTPRQIELG